MRLRLLWARLPSLARRREFKGVGERIYRRRAWVVTTRWVPVEDE